MITSAKTQDKNAVWDGEEGEALFYLRDCGNGGLKKQLFG